VSEGRVPYAPVAIKRLSIRDGVTMAELGPADPDDDIIGWCERNNVLVRFHSNKTVEVKLNGSRRRRATLRLAIDAHRYPKKGKRP
jgi:hypothetical protein